MSQTALLYLLIGTAIGPSWVNTEVVNQPSRSQGVVAPDTRLEKLFDAGCVVTEGVAIGLDGMIYFSDITFGETCRSSKGTEAGHIWKYDPNNGKATVFRSPSGMSNGIKFDAEGNMIVAEGADFGGRRITRTDMQTGKSYTITGLYNGRPYNSPNDLCLDEKGRIYFTDPRYVGHEPIEQPVMGVYRIDLDGSSHLIITDAGKPNGIAISPDQRTLYVASNDNGVVGQLPKGLSGYKGRMALLAYDLAMDGSARFRETLVDFTQNGGPPDGLTVDVEGNVYVAVSDLSQPGIHVYSHRGQRLAIIPILAPSNVSFGRGDTKRVLYITAGKSLYRIQTIKEGYHLPLR